jgi:hypothetical protein
MYASRFGTRLRKTEKWQWHPSKLDTTYATLMRQAHIVAPFWEKSPKANRDFARNRDIEETLTGGSLTESVKGKYFAPASGQYEFHPIPQIAAILAQGGFTIGMVITVNTAGGSDRHLLQISGATTRDPGTGIAGASSRTASLVQKATTNNYFIDYPGSGSTAQLSGIWSTLVAPIAIIWAFERNTIASTNETRLIAVNLHTGTRAELTPNTTLVPTQESDGYLRFGSGVGVRFASFFMVKGAWPIQIMRRWTQDPYGPFRERKQKSYFFPPPPPSSVSGVTNFTGESSFTPGGTVRAIRVSGATNFTGESSFVPGGSVRQVHVGYPSNLTGDSFYTVQGTVRTIRKSGVTNFTGIGTYTAQGTVRAIHIDSPAVNFLGDSIFVPGGTVRTPLVAFNERVIIERESSPKYSSERLSGPRYSNERE